MTRPAEQRHRLELQPAAVRRLRRQQRACSWDSSTPFSWRDEHAQNATQVFYYVNKFHDHLRRRRSASPRRPATSRRDPGARRRPGPDRRRRQHRRRPARRRTTSTTRTWPRRPTAARRRCRCTCSAGPTRPTRPADATAATTPPSSTTSTPTACPTGWSSTPTATRRWATSQAGAMGEALERLVRDGLPRQPAASTADTDGRRRRPTFGVYVGTSGPARPASAPSRSTARSAATTPARLQRRPRAGTRRLHLRRLRQGRSAARGARRRRDLGGDAVGPARRRSARRHRAESLVTRAMELSPPEPVVPRHAQRDPAGRQGRLRRRAPRRTIWQVFAHRGMGWSATTTGSATRRRSRRATCRRPRGPSPPAASRHERRAGDRRHDTAFGHATSGGGRRRRQLRHRPAVGLLQPGRERAGLRAGRGRARRRRPGRGERHAHA